MMDQNEKAARGNQAAISNLQNNSITNKACTQEISPFLTAALEYVQNGFAVFPLIPRTKKPLTTHGFLDASKDPDQIRSWWTQWPNANVAIATGKVSGIFVIDIDGEYPADWPPLDRALTVKTKRGYHYYYRYPESGIPSKGGLKGKAVDIQSDGKYVVVPPSIHPDGGRYEFIA